jgi:hypothetical protein
MSPTVDTLNRSAIDIRMPRAALIRPATHGLDRAAAVLDDRDAGEPGKGRQGCSDFTDAFGIH